jgi:hypothetical protein
LWFTLDQGGRTALSRSKFFTLQRPEFGETRSVRMKETVALLEAAEELHVATRNKSMVAVVVASLGAGTMPFAPLTIEDWTYKLAHATLLELRAWTVETRSNYAALVRTMCFFKKGNYAMRNLFSIGFVIRPTLINFLVSVNPYLNPIHLALIRSTFLCLRYTPGSPAPCSPSSTKSCSRPLSTPPLCS